MRQIMHLICINWISIVGSIVRLVCEEPMTFRSISISSPIARALIGKSKGDSAEVTTPKGSRSYEVLKIEWK